MTSAPRALRRLLVPVILPVLAAPAIAAPAPPAKAPRVAARPVADDGIIPLPLMPIVPAARRTCTTRTPAGLGYTVLRPATGPRPAADATVLVNYIGYLAATGAVFDQGMRTPMPVADVIPGFSQGLQMIGRAGVMRICIPAAMAYGAQASGPIPANSDLVFQIELLDFKTAAEIAAMRAAEAPGTPPPSPQPTTPPQP